MQNNHTGEVKLSKSTKLRVGLLILAAIVLGFSIFRSYPRNQAFRLAFQTVLRHSDNSPMVISKLEYVISEDCRVNWQIGQFALAMGEEAEAEVYWTNLLECSPASVDWLFQLFPERRDLAARAVQRYPDKASAWFWLGEVENKADDETLAIQSFTESVRLDPNDGLAWCRLGGLYAHQEKLEEAEEAYWQCCQNGDPGYNGCGGAGSIAERMGDIPAAIEFYLSSHYLPTKQRGEALMGSR